MISWFVEDNSGSNITGYIIYIQQKDGGYSIELDDCDGSS